MDIFLGFDCSKKIANLISRRSRHILLVADTKVYEIWGENLRSAFPMDTHVSVFKIDASETNKNIGVLHNLMNEMVSAGASRKSVVVAFGGGLIGNIAGLAAGLLFRGIELIHVPTTLLAMSDSVVSQKQAVNGQNAKNVYGLYHPAQCVFIDVEYLTTLPSREFSAGAVELCKNGLVFDESALDAIEQGYRSRDADAMIDLVLSGIRSKQTLLQSDPCERSEGMVAEYGHTAGHALELESKTLSHGHAVGLGMLIAATVSQSRGWLSLEDVKKHVRMLKAVDAPIELPCDVTYDALIDRIHSDNKRGQISLAPGESAFILLTNLGNVARTDGIPLVPVKDSEIFAAFERLRSGYFNNIHLALS